jgi:hypothetical protein
MEAVRNSETSVDNYFTRQYILGDNSEHHTRRRENLKSHNTNMFERRAMGRRWDRNKVRTVLFIIVWMICRFVSFRLFRYVHNAKRWWSQWFTTALRTSESPFADNCCSWQICLWRKCLEIIIFGGEKSQHLLTNYDDDDDSDDDDDDDDIFLCKLLK